MKFLIAPDSFKESMTAAQACQAIRRGILSHLPDADIICLPLADGGEGTLSVLTSATGGQTLNLTVNGPLLTPVSAAVGITPDQTGLIEMAEAAGLHWVEPALRNPEKTSTYGVGELIRALLDRGIRRFLVALGGSATNDGGVGLLAALGAIPRDATGQPVKPTGGTLSHIAVLDLSGLDSRLADCTFRLCCDVNNPLTGTDGASVVFGPQKGATPDQVAALDAGLTHWAQLLQSTFARDVASLPGSGAAGGLAAALVAAFDATLAPGIEQILDEVAFDRLCDDVDWVITGEGCLDQQSAAGKVPVGVARRARRFGVPVIAFAGKLGHQYDVLYDEGINLALGITPEKMPLQEALQNGSANLTRASRLMVRLLYPE